MLNGIAPQGPFLLSPRQLRQLEKDVSLDEMKISAREIFGTDNNYFLSSGRACFLMLLRALQKHSGAGRDKVIIPAYTCPSVPFTIQKAGLRVTLCEINDKSFSLDEDHLARLIDDRVLAIVPTHLFGIPTPVAGMKQRVRNERIFIVEDCSHAIGAWLGSQRVGSMGDAAFSSLGRGKLLTTGEGGMLQVSSDDLVLIMEETLPPLEETPGTSNLSLKMRLYLLHFVVAKNNWGLITKSPLDPEKKERSYDFRASGLSKLQISLLKLNLENMDDFNQERVKRAEVLTENLSGVNEIRIPTIPSEDKPVFMMYPLIFRQKDRMQRAYEKLRSRGYGCSRMYKSSLNVILGDRFTNREDCFPQTEEIAQGLLTLPCHPYVDLGELKKIIETVIQS